MRPVLGALAASTGSTARWRSAHRQVERRQRPIRRPVGRGKERSAIGNLDVIRHSLCQLQHRPRGAGLSITRGAARMTGSRQLHLGAFMRPVGIHSAWWRYPAAYPDANFNLKHLIRFAQTLERGRFDAWFMADHLGVLNMPMAALKRSATVTSFDPLTLLPALAMVTEHLGLIATASTTFEPPYLVARRFASLDHISGGRAAWNLVTTSNPDSALKFGMTEHMEHGERYRRAREFFDVVTGL